MFFLAASARVLNHLLNMPRVPFLLKMHAFSAVVSPDSDRTRRKKTKLTEPKSKQLAFSVVLVYVQLPNPKDVDSSTLSVGAKVGSEGFGE